MRLPNAALLALPAGLLPLVLAIPAQVPFTPPTCPERPLWRTLSDQVIERVWGLPPRNRLDSKQTERQAPAHTLARYGEDVVLRFNISRNDEAQALAEAADTLLLDVWEFSQDWVDIRLSKDIVAPLLGLLPSSLQNSHAPLLLGSDLAQAVYNTYPTPRGQHKADIQRHAEAPAHHGERMFSPSLSHASGGGQNLFFADYQPLSVIEPWMRLLASLFTTHVRKISLGTSYEGRDIPALRVGVHPTNNDKPETTKRNTILITAGSHAREWISTSTVNYIAYNLITGYGKNPAITRLLESFDFVFVPTLNPDGYAYTWETDRLWRKTRQRTAFRFCKGIDLDHSFGFEWSGSSTVNTAGNPCSESFSGEAPFEAVEAQALADWAKKEVEENNVTFVGFLDLHSYSQEILYPYSYSCTDTPPGLENLEELAVGLGKAIRLAHGNNYEVMPACEGNVASTGKKQRLWPRIEAAGGSALDWFYHEMKVRYAYQIKLRDRGMYGFLLPKEEIIPTGQEILDAVMRLGGFLMEVYEAGKVGEAMMTEQEHALSDEEPNDGASGRREQSKDGAGDGYEMGDLLVEDVHWEMKRRRRR